MPDSDAEQAPISPEPEITTPHETPAEEPAPMLDVHPPHETAHSWRDFFIHIATICIGLLIAIGLEQSVEAIHHRHQREDLEHQMHAESVQTLDLVDAQILYTAQSRDYLDACIRALQSAAP